MGELWIRLWCKRESFFKIKKDFNKYIYKFDCGKLVKEHVIKSR